AAQQTVFEQLGQPLGVEHIALAAREDLDVGGVHELELEGSFLQHVPVFQYEPVASITTSVTPCAANQSAIASRSPVNDENVLVCRFASPAVAVDAGRLEGGDEPHRRPAQLGRLAGPAGPQIQDAEP